MTSADCRRALAALQAQEASTAAPRDDLQQLDALRRQAARACLGGQGDPPPPSQRYPLPAAPPPAATRAPAASPIPAPPPPPPISIPQPAKPSGVTGCDAAGCWTPDGTRLRRSGSTLIGPRGPCTTHGTVLRCP